MRDKMPTVDKHEATGKDITAGRQAAAKTAAARPVHVDKDALNAINAKICECDDRIDALNDRIDALNEQKHAIKAERESYKMTRHDILHPPEPDKQKKIDEDKLAADKKAQDKKDDPKPDDKGKEKKPEGKDAEKKK